LSRRKGFGRPGGRGGRLACRDGAEIPAAGAGDSGSGIGTGVPALDTARLVRPGNPDQPVFVPELGGTFQKSAKRDRLPG
jgi:hypothetical protein